MAGTIDEVCQRIRELRIRSAGPRGKAAFAKMLHLPATTYEYYEGSRLPPADVLLRIAETTGADLRWILTGEHPEAPSVAADHPVLRRAAALLAEKPQAAETLAEFLDVLAGGLALNRRAADMGLARQGADEGEAGAAAAGAPPFETADSTADAEATQSPRPGWIPVLGRSAAGLPAFFNPGEPTKALTTLSDLIARHAHKAAEVVNNGIAVGDEPVSGFVQLVKVADGGAGSVDEFVVSPAMTYRYPDAFALRVDGDSMSPQIRHRDIVVLSPSAPAVDGQAAVVQLAGQIGVTCKLFRQEGDSVHLIPINEQLSPQQFAANKLMWALRVLACVR